VVVTEGPVAASPCGICRQFLVEFARDMRIVLVAEKPKPSFTETTLATLLPNAFGGEQLPKKPRVATSRARKPQTRPRTGR
jgi:cytidine deaminase